MDLPALRTIAMNSPACGRVHVGTVAQEWTYPHSHRGWPTASVAGVLACWRTRFSGRARADVGTGPTSGRTTAQQDRPGENNAPASGRLWALGV